MIALVKGCQRKSKEISPSFEGCASFEGSASFVGHRRQHSLVLFVGAKHRSTV